jgi:hypothetical protein
VLSAVEEKEQHDISPGFEDAKSEYASRCQLTVGSPAVTALALHPEVEEPVTQGRQDESSRNTAFNPPGHSLVEVVEVVPLGADRSAVGLADGQSGLPAVVGADS